MSMFRQSVLVAGTRFVDKAMSLIIILLLSRHFKEEGLGEFYYFFNLVSLFIPLMDVASGMTLLQRWHERDAAGRRLLMTQLIVLKFSLGALALLLALGGDAINHPGRAHPLAVLAALMAIFFDDLSELLRRPAHAQGRYLLEVSLPLVSRAIQLAAVLAFVNRLTDGFQVIYIYAVANSIETLGSIFGARGCEPTTLRGARAADWWSILANGAPFAMSSLFCMASLNFDAVMLGHYDYETVGVYGSATRIVVVMNVLNGGICHALFPKLIKAKADNDPAHAGWLIKSTLRGFILIFGGISIGGAVVGQSLMEILYGDKFASTGSIFRLLSPLILLSAFSSLLGQSLEILGEQARVMRIYAVSALLNVLGNILLIPRYGMYGSAAATLGSSTVTTILLWRSVFKNKQLAVTRDGLGRAGIFLLLLTGLYFPLGWLNAWVAVPLGGALFAALLLPFRGYWLEGMGRLSGKSKI